MSNIVSGNTERDFHIWIDPSNIIIQHQIKFTGGFTSIPQNESNENLMFIPNPDFKGFVSFFQNNLLTRYIAEYNLELCRRHSFQQYPARLQAIFLLDSEQEAQGYRERHPKHVGNRVLRKIKTVGEYIYSKHDSSWVDFLISLGMKDQETINNCTKCYWNGTLVKDCELQSLGKPWTQDPIVEVLFLGRIEFYNKKLNA